MLLDLREIIGVPGGKVLFDYEPDLTDVVFGSIVRTGSSPRASGNVVNRAGVLTFTANVDADCFFVCARCLKEFKLPVHKQIIVYLTEAGEGEDPDGYFLQGDMIDADEIIVTEFILDTDERLMCREDCAGLCQQCGADLNDGSCACGKVVDPRLAILGQLLDG